MFRLSTRLLRSFYRIPSSRFSTISPQPIDSAPFQSTVYIEQMYNLWLKSPEKVHASWHDYFKEIQAEELMEKAQASHIEEQARELTAQEIEKMRADVIKIYFYIRSFNKRGHELANLDPLNMDKATKEQSGIKVKRSPELDLQFYGFTESDLDREYPISEPKIAAFLKEKPVWTLREIDRRLHEIYCGNIGYEYHHLSLEEKKVLREMIETTSFHSKTKKEKLKILETLAFNEHFSLFLKNTFSTSKRFGIEGSDTFISGLSALVDEAARLKTEQIMFGMAHRGRLNTLATVFNKPLSQIFAEFQEIKAEGRNVWGDSGDVKYHLGTTQDKVYPDGHTVRLTILANPSHLESVNPVVYGKARAFQDFDKDSKKEKVLGVLIHGDAALAGQGVVYESLQFQDLRGYSVGGVIHIVINNQIGFTTTPREARSSLYCTDIAKAIGCPIFHVNGDDPEAVDSVMKLAMQYRNRFKKDVFIDIYGYRRYGHNELDQPAFTQPLMYQIIERIEPIYQKYARQLIEEGVLTPEIKKEKENEIMTAFKRSYEASKKQLLDKQAWVSKQWESITESGLFGKLKDTGVPKALLLQIGKEINTLPEKVKAHPQIQKIYQQRLASIEKGEGIDFATAEALAFATLIYEGYGVRVSGQDVKRGTFSHRHAAIYDQETNASYMPLKEYCNKMQKGDSSIFSISNSPLSEFGVLGFEYGYSIANHNVLVCWEGQFGDFANGAQVIIDNYITSGEYKWGIQSGLTMILPHGMDGQGPEHSSANMHRYLQAMDDDIEIVNPSRLDRVRRQIMESNMQIVYCSNSANYFHVLRRQLRRKFRKPLIIFSSKSLLRFKGATSTTEEMSEGKRFRRVIEEAYPLEVESDPEKIERVVICSGQVYYDILEKRRELKSKNMVIIRVEQLAPFPYDHFKATVMNYRNAHFIWCQEEHQNFGAWFYVSPRIENVLDELEMERKFEHNHLHYVGRRMSPVSATGSSKIHRIEKERFLNKLFDKI